MHESESLYEGIELLGQLKRKYFIILSYLITRNAHLSSWFPSVYLCNCNFRKWSRLSLCFFRHSQNKSSRLFSSCWWYYKCEEQKQQCPNLIILITVLCFQSLWPKNVGHLIKSRWEHKEVLPKYKSIQTFKILYQKRPSEIWGAAMAFPSILCLSIVIPTLSENWCDAQLLPFEEYFLFYSFPPVEGLVWGAPCAIWGAVVASPPLERGGPLAHGSIHS